MSVYRPKASGSSEGRKAYRYDFQFKGRRFSGSTGKTSKREAEQFVKDLKAELSQVRDDTTIDGAFQRFWEEKGQHYAKSDTVFWRLETLQDILERFLKEDGKAPLLSNVSTDMIARYTALRRTQVNRRKKLPAPATINREIQLLRTVMRYAVQVWEKDLILPAFGRVLDDEPEERIVEITREEQEALKKNLREDYHDVLDFLSLAANRAGNVLQHESRTLRPEDVDLQNRVVTFHVKSKKPGGRRVHIPITEPMLVILANNLGKHPDSVFTYLCKRTDKKRGKIRGERYPLALGSFYTYFKKAAAAIGRPELRVHDLRHTALTRTMRATGGNLRAAQNQAGHTRVTTTEKYAHVMMDDLRKALETAHESHTKSHTENEKNGQPIEKKA